MRFVEIGVEVRVLERDRGLRGQEGKELDAGWREHVRGDVVLEVQHADKRALFHERQAEYRPGVPPADILIRGKRIVRQGIVQNHPFPRAGDITDDRLRKLNRGIGCFAQTNNHGAAAGVRFRLDRQFVTARQHEQPTFRAGVLDGRAQQCLDELLQHNLA